MQLTLILRLKNAGIPDPEATFDTLSAYVLQIPYSEARIRRITGKIDISSGMLERLETLCERRISGEPLEYITGEREFFGLTFICKKDVLIPRNDTEILVEAALRLVPEGGQLCDLCTGTGCVGLSVVHESNVSAVLCDISDEALSCARENAERLTLTDKVKIIKADVFTDIPDGLFDIITANPPYITSEEMLLLPDDVKNEPSLALFGGDDGLDYYRAISARFKEKLTDDGYILFEVGCKQSDSVSEILAKNGFMNIKTKKDYNNTERVVIGQYSRNNI